MLDVSNRPLEALTDRGLTCPACRQRLDATSSGVSCACGLARQWDHGALDLTLPDNAPPATHSGWAEDVMAALGMPESPDTLRAIQAALGPVSRTGNGFFDAEEDILLERFNRTNFRPRGHVGPIYAPAEVEIGRPFICSVRVTNDGPFSLGSSGEQPIVVSYHWLSATGEMLVFEGARSALPTTLQSGRAATALVDVLPLPNATPGDYILRFHLLHELVARLPGPVDVNIRLTRAPVAAPPDTRKGVPFSEPDDSAAAIGFMNQHFQPEGLVIEIGGGLMPIFVEGFPQPTPATFVNVDASLRLLRLSQAIWPRPDVYALRADANTLPFADGSADTVIYCRSLHHFPDLHNQMRDALRVLKPGGQLILVCEPVGTAYDAHTLGLIEQGVNEQVFPGGAYERMAAEAGFRVVATQMDWAMSFKGVFAKP